MNDMHTMYYTIQYTPSGISMIATEDTKTIIINSTRSLYTWSYILTMR